MLFALLVVPLSLSQAEHLLPRSRHASRDNAPAIGPLQFPEWVAGPPPSPPPGIGFNASFSDWMVLQQSPAKACLTGTIGPGGTGASLKVESSDDVSFTSYVAEAVITGTGDYRLWKACLKPQAGAGEFKLTASCTGCTNATTAEISRAVFGEVWYCGGQRYATFMWRGVVCANRRVNQ